MKKDRAQRAPQQPRYRQLADELIGEIRGGRLRVGQTLPGELELGESYGVSRHTVREALRMLEDLGLITRQQGVGTVVTASESSEAYVQKVRSPAQLMQYPPEAIDYVVVHELAHLRHMNHSAQFYALIEQYMPDYKARRALLK